MAVATFGAGCFWGVEAAFRMVHGVTGTAVGYAGGETANPTYEQVCTDRTGHAEVVQVDYNPDEVSYEKLLDVFWNCHNPTTLNRQGPDVGSQYRSAIFALDDAQLAAAECTRDALAQRFPDRPAIVTEILPATQFWPAEDYHQDYYKKNSVRYRYYRWGCGRDQRLEELWGEAGRSSP